MRTLALATQRPMSSFRFLRPSILLPVCLAFCVIPCHARKKTLPTRRWRADAPGCEFQRGDDGRYRWRMAGDNLDMTLLMDSQELSKSQHRLYKPVGVYLSVSYTGKDKFDFPADLRMEFVRHHNVVEESLDATEFATRIQNDVDTKVFDTEREIKRDTQHAEATT